MSETKRPTPITSEDLSKYQEVDELIKKICNLWAAQEGYGYSAANIYIHKDKIYFYTKHYDGVCIFNEYDNMPIEYLFDTSRIEQDAKEYYNNKREKRMSELKEREDLERDPKVIKYKQLIDPNYFIRRL